MQYDHHCWTYRKFLVQDFYQWVLAEGYEYLFIA